MVRECRPPAREPARSWLARRSTMATSTFASASSAASISPVGPPPAITTACPDTALTLVDPPEHRLDVDDRGAVERLEVGHLHPRAVHGDHAHAVQPDRVRPVGRASA